MRARAIQASLLLVASLPALVTCSAAQRKKDYLTAVEADKIRDAETPSERIKLFLTFADDRLKKFLYEVSHPSADRRRAERLNALLNEYAGCVDDAAELVSLGLDKQEDIREGVKQMQGRAKEFLAALEKLATDGAERDSYKDTLDDAIEGTRDALKDAEKAAKQAAPPPVRRKQ